MADVDRGVSPVFGYALTLSVSTMLVAGLLIAAGGYVDRQQERTAENELTVVGNQIAADIAAADRLSRTDGTDLSTLSITRATPERVVGSQYRIHVRDDGAGPTDPYLELTATGPDVTVTVGVAVAPGTDVAERTVRGGRIAVEVDGGELVVLNE